MTSNKSSTTQPLTYYMAIDLNKNNKQRDFWNDSPAIDRIIVRPGKWYNANESLARHRASFSWRRTQTIRRRPWQRRSATAQQQLPLTILLLLFRR